MRDSTSRSQSKLTTSIVDGIISQVGQCFWMLNVGEYSGFTVTRFAAALAIHQRLANGLCQQTLPSHCPFEFFTEGKLTVNPSHRLTDGTRYYYTLVNQSSIYSKYWLSASASSAGSSACRERFWRVRNSMTNYSNNAVAMRLDVSNFTSVSSSENSSRRSSSSVS